MDQGHLLEILFSFNLGKCVFFSVNCIMRRHQKQADGYHIGGKVYEELTGSRAKVWHGTAYKTTGGLKKSDLEMNKHGRIVSKRRAATAKREKRLEKAGYKPKKGKFVVMRKSMKNKSSKKAKSAPTRKRKSSGKKGRRSRRARSA